MAFPIIPSGMFSGQGSATRPNASAVGSVTSGVKTPKQTNLPFAYDGDPNTFAEIYNSGITISNQTQEVLYTHSPATGLLAGSFLYCNINVRASAYIGRTLYASFPNISLVATLSGNYSDTTPIQSSSNPYAILSCPAADIQAAVTSPANSYSKSFNGVISIPFDQFAPLTIDIYSLSLSIKWTSDGAGSTGTSSNDVFDARIYDISYIYL